ncbi:hypothetical protein Tco_0687788 [Tanacetum coccineum]
MEPDISNMTLNEYLMYQGRHKGLERSCTSSKSVAPVRNRILVYHDSDELDEEYCSLPPLLPCFQTPQPCATLNPFHHNNHSEVDIESITLEEYARYELAIFDEILDDLFRIGAENIRKMEYEVPNRCDDINDYEDCDQEIGELLDLPNFYATNEIASDSEQVEENIDIVEEKEEVPMKDVEMDETTTLIIQVRGLLDSFYVVKWLLKYSKLQRRHFKSGLVRYHAEDDDGIFVVMDVARRSRLGAWLRCMRTRSSLNLIVESSTTPKRRNRRRSKQRVKLFSLEETSIVTMTDQRVTPRQGETARRNEKGYHHNTMASI